MFLVWAKPLYYKYSFSISNVFLFTVFFGLTIETIQFFLPYRSFEIMDIVYNTFGSFFSAIIFKLFNNRF